jgi:putative acetyltransferase
MLAPMSLELRPARPGDAAAIFAIHRAAFAGEDEAKLVDALTADGHAVVSLVADDGGEIVGHVLLSGAEIVDGKAATPCLALAPLAVTPSRQRQGIGARLVEASLAQARRSGHGIVIVLGHPEYYPRFGFAPASTFGIRCPFEAPAEAFMALALRPGALEGVRGVVRYAPPFAGI